MKKFAGILALSTMFALGSQGQELYTRLGVGYAFPSAGQMNDLDGFPYNGTIKSGTVTSYNIKTASLSAGSQINVALGYMFNNHVGLEGNLSTTFLPVKYTATAPNVSVGGIASDYSIVNQAISPLFFIPSLVMQAGEGKSAGYVRCGVVLPLRTKVTKDIIVTNLPGTGAIYTDDYVFEVKNSFSLGFAAAAGFKYKIGERKTLWAELNFMSLSVLAKEANLVAVYENDEPVDLSMVIGSKTIKYSKTASVDSNNTQDRTYALPFSNVGLQVGITYSIGGGHNHGKNDIKDRRKKF